MKKSAWYRPDIDRDVIAALSGRGSWFGVAHVTVYFLLLSALGTATVLT